MNGFGKDFWERVVYLIAVGVFCFPSLSFSSPDKVLTIGRFSPYPEGSNWVLRPEGYHREAEEVNTRGASTWERKIQA